MLICRITKSGVFFIAFKNTRIELEKDNQNCVFEDLFLFQSMLIVN